jgi:BolA family transcriptional regulator, general stress-responsive regulator
MTTRIDRIRRTLIAALQPTQIEIDDDSHRHAGHAGAEKGGHYNLRIVSAAFAGLTPIARHRLIYATLGAMMQTEIHALSIIAKTPEEAAQ